jgi:hypothetical protein
MPFTVNWYSESKKAVLIELSAPLTWDEFHRSVQQAHSMILSVPHSVDMVVAANTPLPQGNPFTHFGSAFQRQPENAGKVIIATPTNPVLGFLRQIASIMSRVYPSKSKVMFVNSLQEADKLLG